MNESVKEAVARVRAEMKLDVPEDRTVHLCNHNGVLAYCGIAVQEINTSVVHFVRNGSTIRASLSGPLENAAIEFVHCADCQMVLEALLQDLRETPPAR